MGPSPVGVSHSPYKQAALVSCIPAVCARCRTCDGGREMQCVSAAVQEWILRWQHRDLMLELQVLALQEVRTQAHAWDPTHLPRLRQGVSPASSSKSCRCLVHPCSQMRNISILQSSLVSSNLVQRRQLSSDVSRCGARQLDM